MLARHAALTALLVATLAASACGTSDDANQNTVATAAPADTSPSPDPEPTTAAGTDVADDADGESGEDVQKFPDVIGATAVQDGTTWTISATLSSPYDTPERYADAWRVVGPDGTVYGERILTHDHASEQPFTRSESGIDIPDDVTAVTIEGRDLEFGYGGATYELELPR